MKKRKAVRKTLSPNSAKLKHNALHPSRGRSKPSKSMRRHRHRPSDPLPRSSQALSGCPSPGGGGKTTRKSAAPHGSARKGLVGDKKRRVGKGRSPSKGKSPGREKGPSSAKARRKAEREVEESASDDDDDSESGSESGKSGSGSESESEESGSGSVSGSGEDGEGTDSDGSSSEGESEIEFKAATPVDRSERSPGQVAASRALRKLKKSHLLSRPQEEVMGMSSKYEDAVKAYRGVIVDLLGKEITEGLGNQIQGLTMRVEAGTAKYDGDRDSLVNNVLKVNWTTGEEAIARLAELSKQVISRRQAASNEMQAFVDESHEKLEALQKKFEAKGDAMKKEVKDVVKKVKGRVSL